MIIDILTIKQVVGGRLSLELTLPVAEAEVRSDFHFAEAPVFVGSVENLDRRFKVAGEAQAVLLCPCDRCGATVRVPLAAPLEEYFGAEAAPTEGEEEPEEETHELTGDKIDLFPYVDQALFLARPMKILCREDCRGLCPQCGQDLNEKTCACDTTVIDPRLEILAGLLQDNDK